MGLKKYRIIIAGGREFIDYNLLANTCDKLLKNLPQDEIEIVSGKARGADSLGEDYAFTRGYPVKEFRADWDGLGKRAGFVRNAQMADYGTHLIAFWDGVSKGTKGMIELAEKKGLRVRVKRY